MKIPSLSKRKQSLTALYTLPPSPPPSFVPSLPSCPHLCSATPWPSPSLRHPASPSLGHPARGYGVFSLCDILTLSYSIPSPANFSSTGEVGEELGDLKGGGGVGWPRVCCTLCPRVRLGIAVGGRGPLRVSNALRDEKIRIASSWSAGLAPRSTLIAGVSEVRRGVRPGLASSPASVRCVDIIARDVNYNGFIFHCCI